MRALLDPLHRQICIEIYRKRRDDPFLVLFDIPATNRQGWESAVGYSVGRWSEKKIGWAEQLRTLDAIGDRTVNLRASQTLDKIQFSVFGDKFVLLQAKHKDNAEAKQLWLLESKKLNEAFTAKAMDLYREAIEIDEGWYRTFMGLVSGIGSRLVLKSLGAGADINRRHQLARELASFDMDANDSVSALTAMGFVETRDDNLLRITGKGAEYLALLAGVTPQEA
jgi:hypothetical protein